MDENRAQRLKQIFQEAAELHGDSRETLLIRRCAGDDALRSEVEALLGADDRVSPAFLQGTAPPPDPGPPRRIGRFEIVRRIGDGGMGTVFEAVQQNPRRSVALKLLKGRLLSPETLRRFEYEAQVLANLLHPGIAQVYEAGTERIDGVTVPYFAMELIPGASTITEYARDHALDTSRRLALFAQVCDAVHHGHQKAVIHRDLKPSNIVVDASGRPRVIDFGVARSTGAQAVTPTLHTSVGQIVGTLPYMSPEQCGGDPRDLDVRSDVYSLGVVLYELLCDRLPYDVGRGDILEAARVIRDQPPARTSAVVRILRGDLETIVLKALDKDRARRYQTAGELARDIRNCLNGEPIEARRDSTFYVLRKTIHRYRAAFAGLVVFLLLITASTVIAWNLRSQARDALAESLVAQARAVRQTGQVGQRLEALDALARAAAIRSTLEARNEAIAAMTLTDLRPLRRLEPPGRPYFDNAMQRCLIIARDGAMTVVNVADNRRLMHVPAPAGGVEQVFGGSLAGRFAIRLYDPPTGNRRLEVWSVPEATLHFELTDIPRRARHDISPDGTQLIVGRTDHAIHLYDLESRTELQRLPVDRTPAYINYHPATRSLVLYHADYADARLLDMDTGIAGPVFDSDTISWSVARHPHGRILAGASMAEIELWDSVLERRVGTLTGHEAPVVHLDFSHDGTMLFSASWDAQSVLWDLRTRRPILRTRLEFPTFGPGDAQVGGLISEGGESRVAVFDLVSGSERLSQVGAGSPDDFVSGRGAFHPGTGLLVITEVSVRPGEGLFRVFDVDRRRELAAALGTGISGAWMEPTGEAMLAGTDNGLFRAPVSVHDDTITIGPPAMCFPRGPVASADISADGSAAVVTGFAEAKFAVIDLRNGGRTRELDCMPRAHNARISHDGRWVALGNWQGDGAEVWDVASATRLARFPGGTQTLVAFSPDATRLLVSNPGNLELWDTASWSLLRRTQETGVPRYTPDGSLIFVAAPPRSLVLLDPHSLEQIAVLEPPEPFLEYDTAVSADGTRLVQFTNRPGVAHVWDLPRLRAALRELRLDWTDPPPTQPPPTTPPEWQARLLLAPTSP